MKKFLIGLSFMTFVLLIISAISFILFVIASYSPGLAMAIIVFPFFIGICYVLGDILTE